MDRENCLHTIMKKKYGVPGMACFSMAQNLAMDLCVFFVDIS